MQISQLFGEITSHSGIYEGKNTKESKSLLSSGFFGVIINRRFLRRKFPKNKKVKPTKIHFRLTIYYHLL